MARWLVQGTQRIDLIAYGHLFEFNFEVVVDSRIVACDEIRNNPAHSGVLPRPFDNSLDRIAGKGSPVVDWRGQLDTENLAGAKFLLHSRMRIRRFRRMQIRRFGWFAARVEYECRFSSEF